MNSDKHIPVLDGVRGIAILLVLLFHGNQVPQQGGVGGVVARFAASGWTGVDLFFVLSGFLITGILLDARSRTNARGYFRSFFGRRALRILPLYYGFLFLYFFVIAPWARGSGEEGHIPTGNESLYFWLHGANLWYLKTSDGPYLLGHFWSLSIEEHFYLFWPFVVWFAGRRGVFIAAIVCVCLAPVARGLLLSQHVLEPWAIFAFSPCRIDTLCVGALLACLTRSQLTSKTLTQFALAALVLGGGTVLGILFSQRHFTVYRDPPLMLPYGLSAVAIAFGGFVLLVLQLKESGVAYWVLNAKLLRLFGKVSYGIYVLHIAVMHALRRWVFDPKADTWGGHTLAAQAAFWGLLFAASLLISGVSWRFFEKRFLDLKRYFPVGPTESTKPNVVAAAATAPE